MSIEANTYEELTISNVNEATAEVAAQVGEYLRKTRGINSLVLDVDDKHFEYAEDIVSESSELYDVCGRLSDAKTIMMKLSSTNGGGYSWRMDSCFMALFDNDPAKTANIIYKSTDYYDTDAGIMMVVYDANGLQYPEYDVTADSVKNIEKWFSYTPAFKIEAESQKDNKELHDQIITRLEKLDELIENLDYEDSWKDYGEILGFLSIAFDSKDIPAIRDLLQEIYDLVADYEDIEFELGIYAITEGENDYPFASVAIEPENGVIKDKYCRF